MPLKEPAPSRGGPQDPRLNSWSLDQLERRCWNEDHDQRGWAPSPRLSNPGERERNAVMAIRVGVNMLQFCSVSNSFSHKTLSIKWEVYFSKELCRSSLLCRYYDSACICIMWRYNIGGQPTLVDWLPTPPIIPHRLPAFLESLMPLKNRCSIHARWSKSSLKHSIRFCGIFLSLKQNFIAYRSSKVSSRPDCIF